MLAVPKRPMVRVPVMGPSICAGFPSPADDFTEDAVDIPRWMAPNPTASFLFRVDGECLIDIGIFDGDLLLVDRSLKPRTGCVVVAVIDGERSLKIIKRRHGRVHLEIANRRMPPFEVPEHADVSIWGVARCNIHSLLVP
ncbi:LexA family protein [Microvirga puerhi]|uniref:S24 family peptidase n=1 Tax=Microvirga puerhi TaxID=2876078 RepID=A0ABS7VVM5_9HYPH|nr:S24 family peptidase [Microvirga puerhi]MBZ6078957.1 S24 family peptidase [Microvirga puerhi]